MKSANTNSAGHCGKNDSRTHGRERAERHKYANETSQGQAGDVQKVVDVGVEPIGEGGPTTKENNVRRMAADRKWIYFGHRTCQSSALNATREAKLKFHPFELMPAMQTI